MDEIQTAAWGSSAVKEVDVYDWDESGEIRRLFG